VLGPSGAIKKDFSAFSIASWTSFFSVYPAAVQKSAKLEMDLRDVN